MCYWILLNFTQFLLKYLKIHEFYWILNVQVVNSRSIVCEAACTDWRSAVGSTASVGRRRRRFPGCPSRRTAGSPRNWRCRTASNCRPSSQHNTTRCSAIAEGRRDASCQLKSCQLPRHSAETTSTTSPEPSISCRELTRATKSCLGNPYSSVGFWSWSRSLAVSLQVTWVINPAVGCHW